MRAARDSASSVSWREAGEGCDADGGGDRDGGDHGAAVRLEDVRAHASDVTHVVTHVVGDDAWVTGIVFRNARFHLADEVRADVSALGVMPPPTRENRATEEAPMPKPWMLCALSGSPPKK